MTQIKYEDGRLKITQCEQEVDFLIIGLTHESRQQLINSIQDIE